jgi:hypothetical protein
MLLLPGRGVDGTRHMALCGEQLCQSARRVQRRGAPGLSTSEKSDFDNTIYWDLLGSIGIY